VDADDAEDPGARAAHGADLHDGLIERARIELVAAVPLGLQAAKEPGLLEISEGLVGQPAEPLGLIGALAQRREQRANPSQVGFRCHADPIILRHPVRSRRLLPIHKHRGA
jgi:hypothetical protein